MKKTWKKFLINISIILIVLIIGFFIMKSPPIEINKETTICIGQNSVLYTQLGCHACEAQEKMFGDNYQYLNVTDCFYEKEKCSEIEATPTWKIKGENYKGVQSIEKLKELSGC